MPKSNPIRGDLGAIVQAIEVLPEVEKHAEIAVGFFDLVGSTERKVKEGHLSGMLAALQHNEVCHRVGAKFSGAFVKSLGDGALMTFPSSRDAALAALNIKVALESHTDLRTKIGLTVGAIQHLKVLGQPDIAGTAVDRCARLQALASPGEIVIDEPFVASVETHLSDFDGLGLTGWEIQVLKGIGQVRFRRLRLK